MLIHKPTDQINSISASGFSVLCRRKTRCTRSVHSVALSVAVVIVYLRTAAAQQNHDDLVHEIIEENNTDEFEDFARQQDVENSADRVRHEQEAEDLMRARADNEQRLAREKAERVQQQREEAFEAELQRMKKDEQKAARKQKRKDAKVVQRILRAAKNEDYYGVLGLRNWSIELPERRIELIGIGAKIPDLALFRVTQQQIRRAYRRLAATVHPDKNRDGRAVEAFIAVEDAASILSDEGTRMRYDAKRKELWNHRRQVAQRFVLDGLEGSLRVTRRTVTLFRRFFGPFTVPVLILSALVV